MIFFVLGIIAVGEMPENIKKQVANQARDMYDDRKDAQDFINWQESSYNEIEKKLAQADIPQESKEKIKFYLRGKYGLNFIKQNGDLEEEINRVKNSEQNVKIATKREIEKIIAEKKLEKVEAEINQKSQKELEVITEATELPAPLMARFKSEAERLYPGNYYEQKRYIESSIGNYQYYKNLK